MTDIAQLGLKDAPQVDWENYGKTSAYQVPPPARTLNGDLITYFGVTVPELDTETHDGYMQFKLDPVKLVKGGPGVDGYVIRFAQASLKPYNDKNGNPKKGNPNRLGDFLRACGLVAKPQTNSEYEAAVKMTANKPFSFVIDWEARNKDTQEKVKGFLNFPLDPERPGFRKAILHAGDILSLTDNKGVPTGETYTVKSEVLFANARLLWFRDPTQGNK